jgi:UDP-N-acetylglucosamine 2-epimerase (non-hydrolysing)
MAAELLTDQAVYDQMAKAVNPYGDGQACQRIVRVLMENGEEYHEF